MSLYTIRTVNNSQYFGNHNCIYAFKHKSQAYQTLKNWFKGKHNSSKQVLEIKKHKINDLPVNYDICIPSSMQEDGLFVPIIEFREHIESIWDL